MEALPTHGVKGPFSTITLSLRPFRDKMVTFPNAESKGENIGPKGAVQAPLTQNSAYESSSHNKRKTGKTDQVLYLSDAQSFDHGHKGPGNL